MGFRARSLEDVVTASLESPFSGKRVWISGHTGFKGAWLTLWLRRAGAEVWGFSIDRPSDPCLFDQASLADPKYDRWGDVREASAVRESLETVRPDFVFHLAAQAIVQRSFREPLKTIESNALGTVSVLEALRVLDRRCAAVIVTSDKCYANPGGESRLREEDPLGGDDPYSASKGAAEVLSQSYCRSFFLEGRSPVRLSTARAGNVLGGGDWAQDRILPDCVRAWSSGKAVSLRNPEFIRPWQHVLEPLSGYLTLAAALFEGRSVSTAYNFGPGAEAEISVAELVDRAGSIWGGGVWEGSGPAGGGESKTLRLDSSKAARELGWKPRWSLETGLERVVRWYRDVGSGKVSAAQRCSEDIEAFEGSR